MPGRSLHTRRTPESTTTARRGSTGDELSLRGTSTSRWRPAAGTAAGLLASMAGAGAEQATDPRVNPCTASSVSRRSCPAVTSTAYLDPVCEPTRLCKDHYHIIAPEHTPSAQPTLAKGRAKVCRTQPMLTAHSRQLNAEAKTSTRPSMRSRIRCLGALLSVCMVVSSARWVAR